MTTATPDRRLLTTGFTTTTQQVLARRYTLATLAAAMGLTTNQAQSLRIALGNQTNGNRTLGAFIKAFAEATDGATFTFRVHGIKVAARSVVSKDEDFMVLPICDVACTLGTMTGAAGGTAVLPAERVADTMALTLFQPDTAPKGPLRAMVVALGTTDPAVYSPEDNTEAQLMMPDLGAFDEILIEPYGATASNYLVSLVG